MRIEVLSPGTHCGFTGFGRLIHHDSQRLRKFPLVPEPSQFVAADGLEVAVNGG